MMIIMERILKLDILMERKPQVDGTYHIVFRRDPDLDEDETLGMYMTALSVLFRNMERDLGYECVLADEEE